MVEGIRKLMGETSLQGENLKSPQKAHVPPYPERNESFLEEIARRQCQSLPCKVHQSGGVQVRRGVRNEGAVAGDGGNANGNNDVGRNNNGQANDGNNDDNASEESSHFLLQQWSDDDDDDLFGSDSEDEYLMYSQYYNNVHNNNIHAENDEDAESDDESLESDRGGNDNNNNNNNNDNQVENEPPFQFQQLGWQERTTMGAFRPRQELLDLHTHPITVLLIGIANSENRPIMRYTIDWQVLTSFPDLAPLYPYEDLEDLFGSRLLQGLLRLDPPLDAAEKILHDFPKSCLDMSCFFTACQFVHPQTSRRVRPARDKKSLHPLLAKSENKRIRLNPEGGEDMSNDDDGYDSEDPDEDVGEVWRLVMRQTIEARRLNNIEWGVVVFVGDARTSAAHTKELLKYDPEALIDDNHGAFGISPLDRMISGNFIIGDPTVWAEKLRLVLRAASYVRLTKAQMEQEEGEQGSKKKIFLPKGFFAPYSQFLRTVNSFLSLSDLDSPSEKKQDLSLQSFYPYHELIRLLISPDFGGYQFGEKGFIKTLDACTGSDPNAFLRPDNNGNLPLHVALSSECDTALGRKGERRLIRYLLSLDINMALCPEKNGTGRLPLRMCVENGWPVYDIIISAALECGDGARLKTPEDAQDVTHRFKDHISQIMVIDRPLLHDALNGVYYPRFGIHGARELVKKILSKMSRNEQSMSCIEACLCAFMDSRGRSALHVAIEHKWPVYDILIKAKPQCLESRDPTQHGFFPFQTAACAFATHKPETEKSCASGDNPSEANRKLELQNLLEVSMLFEIIRESPLCITWSNSEVKSPIPFHKLHDGNTQSAPEKKSFLPLELLAPDHEKDDSEADRKRRLSSRS